MLNTIVSGTAASALRALAALAVRAFALKTGTLVFDIVYSMYLIV